MGGLSGKNAVNAHRNQHSVIKNDDNSYSKHKNHISRPGENFLPNPVPGSVTSSLPVSNEKEGIDYLNTSVVRHDSEGQKSAPVLTTDSQGKREEVRESPQIDKSDIAQKTRWGDLEDGSLAPLHENLIGVGIKFGSIGDDSLLSCKKHENIPGVVPCDSYHAQDKDSTATTMDAEIVSHQIPSLRYEDDVFGGNDNDINNKSLEPLKNHEMNGEKTDPQDDRLCCDKKNDEVNKTENGSGINNDFLSVKDAAVVADQAHPFSNEESDIKISEVPEQNCSSSKAVTAWDTESQVPASGPEIVGDTAASVEEVRGPRDGNVENIVSNSPNTSVLEEGDSNESKERFRQRLWCFLFENLNRSVDELYLLCELECDLEQMKEAVLVLEEAASDFKELFTRVEEFEKVKKSSQVIDGVPAILKSDHRRPHALSWEVHSIIHCCY